MRKNSRNTKRSKTGKLFGFINIIDLALLIILLVVGIFAYKYLNQRSVMGDKVEVKFDVEFKNKDFGYSDGIEVGMLVQDSIRGGKYGVIESVQEYPDYLIVYDKEAASFVEAEIPDKYRVKVTILSSGRETDKTIIAGDELIRVGQQVYIKGKGFASEGFITDLEVIR